MRIDAGVKKAIAYRLGIILENLVQEYRNAMTNPYLEKVQTPTQRKAMIRRYKKMVNALKITIDILLPHSHQRHDLPSWYRDIPDFNE